MRSWHRYRCRCTHRKLPSLAAKTLFVAGERDGGVPPEVMREMAAAVPGAAFGVVPGAAHIANMENARAFDTLALSQAVGRAVTLGKIMHGDSRATLKVKISAFASEVRKRIKEITALLAGNSPPGLVLNRHCGQCEFKARCSTQAREKDELRVCRFRIDSAGARS